MERFTKRLPDDLGVVPLEGYGWPEIAAKLAQYEDAEEQGRLIVLPCKAWDTLYDAYTGEIRHHYVTEFSTNGKDVYIQVNDFYVPGGCFCRASDIGKNVFLSLKEAEKALAGEVSK